MTGLERFIEAKNEEIAALERAFAEGRMPSPWPHARSSFRDALMSHKAGALSVIAEFKKASPSRGIICESLEPEDVARQYAENGASCLSILTEEKYFQGDMAYLERAAKAAPDIPLLRKDFIFHPLQVAATLATPASALLLIVRLTPDVALLRALREQAEAEGVEAVVEVFDEVDLRIARESGARIIQVNARDLATLKVDRDACLRLIRKNPPLPGELWIAASGMSSRADLEAAAEAGYHAALVGSALMAQGTPGTSLRRLLKGRYADLRVKICGMNEQSAIDHAASLGADMCGFVFHPTSPRCVSPAQAAELDTHGMARVGVFVEQSAEEIVTIVRGARLDYIQLHGGQSAEFASIFPAKKVIQVLFPARYASREKLQADIDSYASTCGMYLLDAGMGGGKTLDWNALAGLRFPHPWMLAGGLEADNVAEAVAACSPDGVDMNSRLEDIPGRKSLERMEHAFAVLNKVRG
ncbi:MAG: hypothetical protein IJ474_04125 [Mailhella sp.]|nr:hypothetical protein [Mailhella sp.]